MKRYKTSTPRAAVAVAAVAMTVITLGLAVVVPATIEHSSDTLAQASTVVDRVAAAKRTSYD